MCLWFFAFNSRWTIPILLIILQIMRDAKLQILISNRTDGTETFHPAREQVNAVGSNEAAP